MPVIGSGNIDIPYSLIVILLIAVLTFAARLLPFVLFSRGDKEPPALVTYIGEVLPPAVMILLIVYCLRFVDLSVYPYGIPEALSMLLVLALYKLMKNNLIAMVGGTALYMVLINVF